MVNIPLGDHRYGTNMIIYGNFCVSHMCIIYGQDPLFDHAYRGLNMITYDHFYPRTLDSRFPLSSIVKKIHHMYRQYSSRDHIWFKYDHIR